MSACPEPPVEPQKDAAVSWDAGRADAAQVDRQGFDAAAGDDAATSDDAFVQQDATTGDDAALALDAAVNADAAVNTDAAAADDAVLGDAAAADDASLAQDARSGEDAAGASDASVAEDAWTNSAPIAQAGSDQADLAVARPAQLDGSQSFDPDGDTLTYQWSVVSSPDGASPTLDHPEAPAPSFVPDLPGSYSLELVVTDSRGASSAADRVDLVALVRIAVYADRFPGRVVDGVQSTGWTFDEYAARPSSAIADIAGDWLIARESVSVGQAAVAYNVVEGRRVQGPTIALPGVLRRALSNGTHVAYSYRQPGSPSLRLGQLTLETGAAIELTTEMRDLFSFGVGDDFIAYSRLNNGATDVFVHQISTGQETQVNPDPAEQLVRAVYGETILYRQGADLIAHNITTSAEHTLAGPSGDYSLADGDAQHALISETGVGFWLWDLGSGSATLFHACTSCGSPQLKGDHVVWDDGLYPRNVWLYTISTGQKIQVSTTTAMASNARSDGADLISWIDNRDGRQDIYLYRVSTGQEFAAVTDTFFHTPPRWHRGVMYWTDNRNQYDDVWASADLGLSHELVSAGKPLFDESVARRYSALLFLDGGFYEHGLPVFDAADAAGVTVVGLGAQDSSYPIGGLLAGLRFGLGASYDYDCAPLAIDVGGDGQGHPVFAGLDTSATLSLESGSGENDEMGFSMDTSAADSPADWTVLASLGSSACYPGMPTIVTFTTASGTRVLLDGASPTYDGYVLWTAERWTLLINELAWAVGIPAP